MRQTQATKVLQLLRAAGATGITAMDALREIGTMRLAAQVWELRGQGHDIITLTEKHDGGSHARYVLRESGPGRAYFVATDTPASVEAKMDAAFAPLRAMHEALANMNRYVACPHCGGHLLPRTGGGRQCEVCGQVLL